MTIVRYLWRFVCEAVFHLCYEHMCLDGYIHALDSSVDFIPAIIPFWAVLPAYPLAYAFCATLCRQLREPGVYVILSIISVRTAKVFLSPIISSLPKSRLFCFGILDSFIYPRLYQYEAFSSDDDADIRLLRLEGFLFWRRFQISRHPLHKCPPFDAVSYTWDGQDRASCVIVNGRRLSVTRNARQILHDFTPAVGHRMIWIDSICINQGDKEEKRIQVEHMSKIYAQATRVRVWLSETSMLRQPLSEFMTVKARKPAEIFERTIIRTILRLFGSPTMSSGALERLLSHNYWTRAWVVQEIAFAREILVHADSTCVNWKSVSAFASNLWPDCLEERYRAPALQLAYNPFYDITISREVLRGLRQISLILSLRQNTLNGSEQRLLPLLVRLGATRASDPVDKVYSILSLVRDTNTIPNTSNNITIDYDLSVKELYLKVARSNFSQDIKSFDISILMYAGIGWPRTLSGLPSWVPDWSSISQSQLDGFTSSSYFRNAEWHVKAILVSGNLLKIFGGRIVDSISAQTRTIDHNDPARPWFHEICDLVGRQLDHIPKADIDLTGETSRCYRRCPGRWRGAIYRVLVGDSESYWGEVPRYTGVTTFERPDSFSSLDNPGRKWRRTNTLQSRAKLEHSYNSWRMLPQLQREHPERVEDAFVASRKFVAVCTAQTQGWKFALTRTGRMCLVPPRAEVGDELFLLGSPIVPFLVRPVKRETRSRTGKNARRYLFVGHCFALGMMEGGWDHYYPCKPNPRGYDPEVFKEDDIIIQ